jgi:hypothetical protein
MAVIVAPAQVADVVEQRGDEADDEQVRNQRLAAVAAALVAVHQARHRQRDVEHVLDVVILRIARPVPEIAAVVHARDVGEGALEPSRTRVRKELAVNADDFRADRGGIGGANGIADVVVVPTHGRGGFRHAEYRDSIGHRA